MNAIVESKKSTGKDSSPWYRTAVRSFKKSHRWALQIVRHSFNGKWTADNLIRIGFLDLYQGQQRSSLGHASQQQRSRSISITSHQCFQESSQRQLKQES